MSNYFLGRDYEDLNGDTPRYFYALRRTDDGELYFCKVNQLSRDDAVEINKLGPSEENYEDFEVGFDFFEGRDIDHNLILENLNYEQYRWDDKNLWYYIDSDGQLIVRMGTKYNYPTGI